MFIDDGPIVFWKLQYLAGITHGQREGARLLYTHALKIYGHEKCRHLVVRYSASRKCGHRLGDELRRQL